MIESLFPPFLRDTVSSIGIARGKALLPGTVDGMNHVCYFRHALALNEQRVKFLPEYAYGGACLPPKTTKKKDNASGEESTRKPPNTTEGKDNPSGKESTGKVPHTKEVWFAGTHSDM